MKWRISWLEKQPNQRHHVDEVITFDRSMFKNVSNIDSVSPIKVQGNLFIEKGLVNVDLVFTGILYLPCALSNEICDYNFAFKVKEELDGAEPSDQAIDYEADYIDLYELIWQRLIIEAPTKIVKNDNVNKSGNSWKLLSEEEYQEQAQKRTDPRMAKLQGLFSDDKED